jgi:hypothetical protein
MQTTITLEDTEREELRAALLQHIDELTRELAATGNPTYQHDLARTVERLEAIARKLQATA